MRYLVDKVLNACPEICYGLVFRALEVEVLLKVVEPLGARERVGGRGEKNREQLRCPSHVVANRGYAR